MTEREGVLYKKVQTVWWDCVVEGDDSRTWLETWAEVASRLPTETLHELLDPTADGPHRHCYEHIAPIITAELDHRGERWWT